MMARLPALSRYRSSELRSATAQVFDPPGDVPWPASWASRGPDCQPADAPAADRSRPARLGARRGAGPTTPADGEPVPAGQSAGLRAGAVAGSGHAAGPWGVPPVKLTIPALGVEAAIEAVGQDPDGAMSAPTTRTRSPGTSSGRAWACRATSVFAGHVNWAGGLRVFGYLDRLDPAT